MFRCAEPTQMTQLGERIGALLKPGAILALRGGLGAGKTTLTKGLARGLRIGEEITSPTFTLISEYDGPIPLYHMDAYRLSGAEEFLELGVQDLLYGKGICVIEWSERVSEALPEDVIRIDIMNETDGTRQVAIEAPELEEALL